MLKALLFAPMLMLLLTACSDGEEPNAVAELQRQYAAVEQATLEADIVCHYDDEIREYTLLCDYSPERSTITVLQPEDLSGISATMENGQLTLSYEDISLDAGTYSAASISPVAALPKIMEAAAWGYPGEQSEEMVGERSCLRLSTDLSGEPGTVYTTWFDRESLLPLKSEITADGVLVFEITWNRFEITAQGDTTGNTAADSGDAQ